MTPYSISSELYETVHKLPKIELHRHLEGAVRLDTLLDIAQQHAFEMPEYELDTLRPFVQMMPGEQRDSVHFLAKFSTLRQFYRSPEVIHRITREAIEDAAADNIKYMELRFTPRALSTIIRATPTKVITWVCEAAKEATRYLDIDVRLIASMNRHESIDFGEQVLKAALANQHLGVVAIDLAGQESGYPASLFRDIFLEAKQSGMGVTVHAGEWEGPDSVWDAVGNLEADRIGHGIRVMEDEGMVNILADRGITLEVCPTSNVDTGVVNSLEEHPIKAMIENDILATINTDDPLISDITLTEEMARSIAYIGLTMDEVKCSIIRSAEAAFLPDDEKAALVKRLRDELDYYEAI